MLFDFVKTLAISYIYKLALNDGNICISNNSWSIHGLWPDYSNGSYPQYCHFDDHCRDPCSHQISNCQLNITKYIHSDDLLYDMNQYWCSYDLSMNNRFWCHEWCKHGCCIQQFTIEEYFQKGIALFKSLDKYYDYMCYNDDFKPIICPQSI